MTTLLSDHAMRGVPFVYRPPVVEGSNSMDADPITTEVIRSGFNSVAEQMKRTLIRTAFSPTIYNSLDFGVAIFDRHLRLVAQAPTLPLFIGALNFAIEGALNGIGGEAVLEPGDVVAYNVPYGTGAHPQDSVLVAPIFAKGELFGYSVVKAHWMDIGAKAPYCTDTTDVFQEGLLLPGVKLYSRGEVVPEIMRIILANSRLPKAVAGDIQAQAASVLSGVNATVALLSRFDLDTIHASIDRIFDHGEALVRRRIEGIPDGRYTGRSALDNNGVDDIELPFEVVVEIQGSDVRVDFTDCPDEQAGPYNNPFPTTVCGARLAVAMLAGVDGYANEGHFRALEVVTLPGTLFHPLPPRPCFMYATGVMHGMEAIFEAIAQVDSRLVTSCSGGDTNTHFFWGTETASEPWIKGFATPVGQGAWAAGDGITCLHHVLSACDTTSIEVWESKFPTLVEKFELRQDSGGAGEFRGGLGIDLFWHCLEDHYFTSCVDHTKVAPYGLEGGGEGRTSLVQVRDTAGARGNVGKVTQMLVPKGATVEWQTGGGGGYGLPAARPLEKVRLDVADGYISRDFALENYGVDITRVNE